MKEKPILFSTPMVRAIRESRKTQTRRIAKNPLKCPYEVGMRLWVRETFTECPTDFKDTNGIIYKADEKYNDYVLKGEWRPSIHMPRWASRIILEVTGVRVERLQDISEEDAQAEGAERMHVDDLGQSWKTYRRGFQTLWESIYGSESWDANPLVNAIEFKRLEVSK